MAYSTSAVAAQQFFPALDLDQRGSRPHGVGKIRSNRDISFKYQKQIYKNEQNYIKRQISDQSFNYLEFLDRVPKLPI